MGKFVLLFLLTVVGYSNAYSEAWIEVLEDFVEQQKYEAVDWNNKFSIISLVFWNYLFGPKPRNIDEALSFSCIHRNIKAVQTFMLNATNIDQMIDMTKPIVFLIHGRYSSSSLEMAIDYVKNVDTNVCFLEWEKANELGDEGSIKEVAAYVTTWLYYDLYKKHGFTVDKITLVGHDTGAQLAGVIGWFVGDHYNDMFEKKIKEIYALDPADAGKQKTGRRDRFAKGWDRLDPSDADYVQIISTTHGDLNYEMGHQQFIVNLGKVPQLPCNYQDDNGERCSSKIAEDYFRYAMDPNNVFTAEKCNSGYMYLTRKCSKTRDRMGIYAKKTERGKFYLDTFGAAPYVEVKH